MAGRRPLLKLDTGRSKVRKLPLPESGRVSGNGGSQEAEDLHRLPDNGDEGVPNGRPAASFPGGDDGRTLHLAIVVPDISIFRKIKDSVKVIKPHDWEGEVIVHCLLPRKDEDDNSLVFRFALTQLGLVEPKVAELQYPDQVELGWSDSKAPIIEEFYDESP